MERIVSIQAKASRSICGGLDGATRWLDARRERYAAEGRRPPETPLVQIAGAAVVAGAVLLAVRAIS